MVREKDLTAPYIFNKDKWIGFDDEISIKLKVGRLAAWLHVERKLAPHSS